MTSPEQSAGNSSRPVDADSTKGTDEVAAGATTDDGPSGDLLSLEDDSDKNKNKNKEEEEEGRMNEQQQPAPPDGNKKGKKPERLDEAMSSSTLTLKPSDALLDPSSYIDPTPATPITSQPPSRSPSTAAHPHHGEDRSPKRSSYDGDEKRYNSEDEQDGGSRSEIQSIMDQFSDAGGGPDVDTVMSPRLEMTSPLLGSPVAQFPQHPPRKSSLEPLAPTIVSQIQEFGKLGISTGSPMGESKHGLPSEDNGPPVPPKDSSVGMVPRSNAEGRSMPIQSPTASQATIHRPPPPEPEPEPSLPFDFHRFLEQLRNKKADPVARYLKSFLQEFGKKQWMVHEQVKIISDFLAFIAEKMSQSEVWRDVSDAEFDNAREGMEKLVMNRLYTQTFSPAIPTPKPIPGAKPKRKGGDMPMSPGRRGQHQEDVERDDILAQKINIYAWVREKHLDIPHIGDSGRRFLKLAQQELLKIKTYRAPRDKIICVLNCCKVIFGLLKHNKSDSSADSFMPMLIYVVLQSNPDHLVSNVQYILRFRNQEKLGGEAGYYLSSLMGAVQFIESMDRTSLTITDDEFEKNVEAAVSAIAEKHQTNSPLLTQPSTFNEKTGWHQHHHHQVEGRQQQRYHLHSRHRSMEGGSDGEGIVPIGGILKTIQKPLSTIGRIFTDDGGGGSGITQSSSSRESNLPHHPPRLSSRQLSRRRDDNNNDENENDDDDHDDKDGRPSSSSLRHTLSAEEAAARQASAETAEAQRLSRAEHANVVETLSGMFPGLDKEVISDVVYQKDGRVGLAVDACLALSSDVGIGVAQS